MVNTEIRYLSYTLIKHQIRNLFITFIYLPEKQRSVFETYTLKFSEMRFLFNDMYHNNTYFKTFTQ